MDNADKNMSQITAEMMIEQYKKTGINNKKTMYKLCEITVGMILREHSVNKIFYKKVLLDVYKLLYDKKK